MQRRKIAFDYVFVDETQLFNENERRLFPLLTKVSGTNVPVVLALDEAQQTSGASSPGFGLLGLTGLVDESLFAVHRNTQEIVRLAFFVIQRTTDLFGSDFPDFTGRTDALIKDDHSLAEPPVLITSSEDSPSFGKFILRQIRNLRRKNLRQVAVVCHAEKYWAGISSELQGSDLPIRVLTTRGERIDTRAPIVVLARPEKVARILRRRALRPSPLEIGVRAAGSALPRREDCQRFDQTASE